MRPISVQDAARLVDFSSGGNLMGAGLAESQLKGSVAAFNMLARNRCAYLADEVGLGKTYVALGVMAYLRYIKPDARIMVIAPRQNIQRKWVKEQRNFVRNNWLHPDNRVKSLQNAPAHPPVFCGSLRDLSYRLGLGEHQDFFLRMTSFSLKIKKQDDRKSYRKQIFQHMPWLSRGSIPFKDPDEFLEGYGAALNAMLPVIDLLVVDEAHNLKGGIKPSGAVRNRLMATALGRGLSHLEPGEHYSPRVKAALLLSATPFEEEYGAIWRQFDVLGLGELEIARIDGRDPLPLRILTDSSVSLEQKRLLIRRLMLRRVASYKINGDTYTKNMYRREWRQGGYRIHDVPMKIEDTREKLSVALVQKKVSEILQDERFNNRFQIGMLSSFESFFESVGRRKSLKQNDEEERRFAGDTETATQVERRGIDTEALEQLVRSHKRRFGSPMPHPKLDATSRFLADSFATGEKALVFVRRVATVRELASKLEREFDAWIEQRMLTALPRLVGDIHALFEQYREEARTPASNGQRKSSADREEEDSGGNETFFAWFFRGEGPEGMLSGAAYQKNRLSNEGSQFSTLFEDDYVSWLLERPSDVLGALAQRLGRKQEELEDELKRRAFAVFKTKTARAIGYPRIRVYKAYQASALALLSQTEDELGSQARLVLHECFPGFEAKPMDVPAGFPGPELSLGLRSFFTELVRRPVLREELWPDDGQTLAFPARFRRREQRRELLSSMCRLGIAFIDLYLVAMKGAKSFTLQRSSEDLDRDLITDFLDLLEKQRSVDGIGAYRELHQAAEAFDLILAVNFPDIHDATLGEFSRIYGRTLQRQVPVGAMSGQVNRRMVRQFRMPGYPIILISTDLLQEGEDLHTFCARVVHYGITWTPSAMEQRTGRIDRIGSLAQRRLDGREGKPDDREWIQVYYPHLQDTVEYVQVRRVLQRLNRFLMLAHRERGGKELTHGRLDLNNEILSDAGMPAPIRVPLESAFPVETEWLSGASGTLRGDGLDLSALKTHLEKVWEALTKAIRVEKRPSLSQWSHSGVVWIDDGHVCTKGTEMEAASLRRQPFTLQLRSQADGAATLLRCESPVGILDLRNDEMVDALYDLQRDLGGVRVCSRPGGRFGGDRVDVINDMLFDPHTTQASEVVALVTRTSLRADIIEDRLLHEDKDPYMASKVAVEKEDA